MKTKKRIISLILLILAFGAFSSFSQVTPTSNNQETENNTFTVNKIYPNPVKEKLNLEIQLKDKGRFTILVFDIMGNEVVKKEFTAHQSGLFKAVIDLSELHNGIYILKTEKDTHSTASRIKKI